MEEVDLYLGANFVVCVHKKPLPEIEEVRESLRAKDPFISSAANLFYLAFDAVVDEYAPIMERLAEQVDEIEQELLFPKQKHDDSV